MKKQSVLFVDDDPNVLQSYKRSLRRQRHDWEMTFDDNPIHAWERMQKEPFDTVVSDVRMPGMNGLEFLTRIKTEPTLSDIPVVIVTGESDSKLKRQALDLDAADLLNKPVDTYDLIARLKSVLRTKEYSDKLKESNELLERRVRVRTAELNASRIDILWRLGKASEFRDEETGNHVVRVGCYSRVVALALGLDSDYCDNLFLAAPLHDIGKIGIGDDVLLKPGRLTDDEWVTMRRHCEFGVSILTDPGNFMNIASRFFSSQGIVELIGTSNPVLELAAEIAATHHEKWDGSGYPARLAGEEIPLSGRIVAIADVYDALRSERPYKQPFSVEKSLAILRESSGSHFDPQVVEAFINNFEEIQSIENEFGDADSIIDLATAQEMQV